MDLKAGEVSQVFSDPEGAHFIYKMLNKQTLALEDAKTEIRAAIAGRRYRDAIKGFQGAMWSLTMRTSTRREIPRPSRGTMVISRMYTKLSLLKLL